MKKTTKIIIIGCIVTILVLGATLFIMYKNYEKKAINENSNNPTMNTNNSDSNSSTNENQNKKIVLYMFHGSTCPACLNALEKIQENLINTENLEIRTYEVWNNKDNSKLMQKVAEKLNIEAKYVPFFVINDYSTTGYNETNILSEFNNVVNSAKYKDIIAEVLKENPDLNPQYEILK